MNVAIVGSRTFTDYELMKSKCGFVSPEDCIVSGGARGADSLAKKLSGDIGCHYVEYPADWDTHGKSAGYIRNKDIVDHADIVVAFWDGKSKGTKHTIDIANSQQVLTVVHKY